MKYTNNIIISKKNNNLYESTAIIREKNIKKNKIIRRYSISQIANTEKKSLSLLKKELIKNEIIFDNY